MINIPICLGPGSFIRGLAFFILPLSLKSNALFLLLSGLLISSCITYKEVKIVKMAGIEVRELSAKGIDIGLDVQIYNPNNYKISLVKTDLELWLNNKNLGKADVKGGLVFAKNSNETHRIDVSLGGKQLTGALPALLGAALGGRMVLTVKGTVTAKAKFIRKKIDVEFSQPLNR